MSVPPMISADPADGKMKVVLGDMTATFTNQGTPVAQAAGGRAEAHAPVQLLVFAAGCVGAARVAAKVVADERADKALRARR